MSARAAAEAPVPDSPRVRISTELGDVVVLLDGRRAPLTTANFLRCVDEGRFVGKTFYRAARPQRGFIRGGIRRDFRRMLPPTVPNAGRGSMRGQMIERPVRILRVRRIS